MTAPAGPRSLAFGAFSVLAGSSLGETVKTLEDAAKEKRFLDLAREAHTQVFEKRADSPVDEILSRVIELDSPLWKDLQPQLAEYGALVLIRTLLKKSPIV